MGDFAIAINLMVGQLEETMQRLKEREQDLLNTNRNLERLASLDGLNQLATAVCLMSLLLESRSSNPIINLHYP